MACTLNGELVMCESLSPSWCSAFEGMLSGFTLSNLAFSENQKNTQLAPFATHIAKQDARPGHGDLRTGQKAVPRSLPLQTTTYLRVARKFRGYILSPKMRPTLDALYSGRGTGEPPALALP